MNMKEIDPKLFVTCRLCLDEMGVYQIVPKIQEEIKFCYEIDVQPFDGFPQLICKKCQIILSDFDTKKKYYQDKQNRLKLKINADVNFPESSTTTEEPQQSVVTSTEQNDTSNDSKKNDTSNDTKKNDTSNDTNDETLQSKAEEKSHKEGSYHRLKTSNKDKSSKKSLKYRAKKFNYYKRYKCKLCSRYCSNKYNVKLHIQTHKSLLTKYSNVFSKYCFVNLNRVDESPNLLNSFKAVVLDKHKIVRDYVNEHYSIFFYPKNRIDDELRPNYKAEQINHESTDDDNDEVVKQSNRKRPRLLSQSSNDTVILQNDNKDKDQSSKNELDIENEEDNTNKVDNIINIEDSSEDESVNKPRSERSLDCPKAKLMDYKTIHNIINMCHSKFIKKVELPQHKGNKSANTENALKHKVLSIGRKVINKQSFNCTGILRYLDYKNLQIIWTPTKATEESNYIRIITALKDPKKVAKSSEWEKIEKPIKNKPKSKDTSILNTTNNTTDSNDTLGDENTAFNYSLHSEDGKSAFIYLVNNTDFDPSIKKLLNKNPVANPKKLPKKPSVEMKPDHVTSSQSSKTETVYSMPLIESTNNLNINDVQDNQDENIGMPIITSTTSLAPRADLSEKNKNINENLIVTSGPSNENSIVNKPSAPRIKVKPVSELMPEPTGPSNFQFSTNSNVITLHSVQSGISYQSANNYQIGNILQLQNAIHPTPAMRVFSSNSIQPVVQFTNSHITPVTSVATPNCFLQLPTPVVTQEELSHQIPATSEYLILHTPELPNLKTKSPFNYFKNLLQIHHITLLDADEPLTKDYNCLIKYKVLFKTSDISGEITLNSSLKVCKNKFCLKISDNQQAPFDLCQLTAYWQWEIIKTYKSKIVNKILDNARKISLEVYENTNRFICLLKSIEVHKVV